MGRRTFRRTRRGAHDATHERTRGRARRRPPRVVHHEAKRSRSAARALWKSRAPLGASSRHRPDMLTCFLSAAAPARVRATRAFTVGAGARACRAQGVSDVATTSSRSSPTIVALVTPEPRPCRGRRRHHRRARAPCADVAPRRPQDRPSEREPRDDDDDAIPAFVPSDPFSQTPEERKERTASCEEGRRRATRNAPDGWCSRRRRRPRHASLPSCRPHPSVPYDSPILAPA